MAAGDSLMLAAVGKRRINVRLRLARMIFSFFFAALGYEMIGL
jgi:hypothetical protein